MFQFNPRCGIPRKTHRLSMPLNSFLIEHSVTLLQIKKKVHLLSRSIYIVHFIRVRLCSTLNQEQIATGIKIPAAVVSVDSNDDFILLSLI